jgi:hypothetical protein
LAVVADSVSVVVGTVGISVVSVVAEEVGEVVALADLAAGSAASAAEVSGARSTNKLEFESRAECRATSGEQAVSNQQFSVIGRRKHEKRRDI